MNRTIEPSSNKAEIEIVSSSYIPQAKRQSNLTERYKLFYKSGQFIGIS